MNHEKIHAEFKFIEKYTNKENVEKFAAVILQIDYKMKNYNIVPNSSASTVDKFTFIRNSQNSELWKAVLRAIEKAIDFGDKEIEEVSK